MLRVLLRFFLKWIFFVCLNLRLFFLTFIFIILIFSANHIISEDISEATSTFMFLDLLKHLQLFIKLNLSLRLLFDHLVCLIVDLEVAKWNALQLDKLLIPIH